MSYARRERASKLKPGYDVRLDGWKIFRRVTKVEASTRDGQVWVTFAAGYTLGLDYFEQVEVRPR